MVGAFRRDLIRAFRATIPTYRARFTNFVTVLLTLFAIAIGSLIGRVRGGAWSGVSNARLRATPFLIVSIAAVLVQAVLDPVFPQVWSFVGLLSLIIFGFRNLHLSGMAILLIGTVLNLLPFLANGATPVSELALISVGDLDPFNMPDIDGARESSSTATRLRFLGDAIPVPVFGSVISIGDMIALVGVADIFTNLFLRARRRDMALDDAGVTFDTPAHAVSNDRVAFLSPLQTANRQPSHAAHRRPRRKAAPSSHVPAHAATMKRADSASSGAQPAHAGAPVPNDEQAREKPSSPAHAANPVESSEPATPIVIDLDAPEHAAPAGLVDKPKAANSARSDDPPAHAADPVLTAGLQAVPVMPSTATQQIEVVPELIDLTDPNDQRPIIDLTKSPTDDQMTEFLRRRKAADREHALVAVRPPGQRRGRAPVRLNLNNVDEVNADEVVETLQ